MRFSTLPNRQTSLSSLLFSETASPVRITTLLSTLIIMLYPSAKPVILIEIQQGSPQVFLTVMSVPHLHGPSERERGKTGR